LHGTVVEQLPIENPIFYGLLGQTLFHRFQIFICARRAPLAAIAYSLVLTPVAAHRFPFLPLAAVIYSCRRIVSPLLLRLRRVPHE
jgi:hypothetical protein